MFALALTRSDPSVLTCLRRKLNAQNLSQCINRYTIKLKLCSIVCWRNRVTVWRFTIDFSVLRLTKIFRPDFKHSITFLSCYFLVLYENILQLSPLYSETESFWAYASSLNTSENLSFFIFSSRLPYASLKRFLKILPTGCSGSLLRNLLLYWNLFLKTTFPTAFAHEYSRGLRKRTSPLKKDPTPLPFVPWNYLCKHDLFRHHYFDLRSTVHIDPL
jgi:hypothetical protein